MLSFYIIFAACLVTYTVNADEAVLGNGRKRHHSSGSGELKTQKNANKLGKNNAIDNIKMDKNPTSTESKERSAKSNKPNNYREKKNYLTIPQENNQNGLYGRQNNYGYNNQIYPQPSGMPYYPHWNNYQPINQEDQKRLNRNQRIGLNQIPAGFNNYGRNPNLNLDLSDGGLMINGKKVTRTPGKKVNYNGDECMLNGKNVPGSAFANQGNVTVNTMTNGKRPSNSNNVTFNNSNNTGYTDFNQNGVTTQRIGDSLIINGKKVPGIKANEVTIIQWGNGVLKVNGKRIAMFNKIKGSGIINLSNVYSDEDSYEDSDEDSYEDSYEDSDEDSDEFFDKDSDEEEDSLNQRYTKLGYQNHNYMMDKYGNINSFNTNQNNINSNRRMGNNIPTIGGAPYENMYNNDRKRPRNESRTENITMGSNGIKISGPNGLKMDSQGIRIKNGNRWY